MPLPPGRMRRPPRPAVAAPVMALVVALVMALPAPGSAAPASAPSVVTWPATGQVLADGPARHVGSAFFGVNGARIISRENAAQWHQPAFTRAVSALAPGFLRVQGGTTSQWIDWRTGRFDERPDSPYVGNNDGRRPLTMSDWAALVRATGAEPVYDLNVTTSTPADQVAMLREAARLGMPVRYVELGNELYVGEKEYQRLYPTGADYARAMNHWIRVLRAAFGDLRIAVSAADTSSEVLGTFFGHRYQTWNRQLYAGITGADAVALHPYWFPTAVDAATASAAAGTAAWKAFSHEVLDAVPPGLEVWLTELNQMDVPWTEVGVPTGAVPGAKQTWAVGLSLASFLLRAIGDARVTMAVVHSPLNGLPVAEAAQSGGNMEVHALLADGSGGSVEFGRTAENIAITPLFAALRAQPSAEVQPLRSTSAPGAVSVMLSPFGLTAVPGVVGTRIGSRTVLINLTGTAVRVIGAWAGPASATVLSAPPRTRPAFTPGDGVTSQTTRVTGPVLLPAYSETVLSAP